MRSGLIPNSTRCYAATCERRGLRQVGRAEATAAATRLDRVDGLSRKAFTQVVRARYEAVIPSNVVDLCLLSLTALTDHHDLVSKGSSRGHRPPRPEFRVAEFRTSSNGPDAQLRVERHSAICIGEIGLEVLGERRPPEVSRGSANTSAVASIAKPRNATRITTVCVTEIRALMLSVCSAHSSPRNTRRAKARVTSTALTMSPIRFSARKPCASESTRHA